MTAVLESDQSTVYRLAVFFPLTKPGDFSKKKKKKKESR